MSNELIMAVLRSRCGHYIFALWFLLLSFFYISPNLSRRNLDVCHTSVHGVASVRIQNAGLKCAARGSLQMQDPQKLSKIAIWAPSRKLSGYIFATKACIDNRKKVVKQQYLL